MLTRVELLLLLLLVSTKLFGLISELFISLILLEILLFWLVDVSRVLILLLLLDWNDLEDEPDNLKDSSIDVLGNCSELVRWSEVDAIQNKK